MTWDEFEIFHKTCYHPGNAMIFFYGDDDTSKRLELLEEYVRRAILV